MVVITEKGRKRWFRGLVTKECGVGLVEILGKLEGYADPGSQVLDGLWWRDYLAIVVVSVGVNANGSVAQINITLVLVKGGR